MLNAKQLEGSKVSLSFGLLWSVECNQILTAMFQALQ